MDYWDKVEPYWEAVSIYDGGEIFVEQYTKLPKVSRTLLAAHWLQSEVNNGGFHQFLANSTAVLAPEAIEALNELGMPICADIVARAISPFGIPYPRDRNARESASDECWDWDFLDQLSGEFYKMIDTENGGFETAANAYAVKNSF